MTATDPAQARTEARSPGRFAPASRTISGTAFACVLLALLLPFGSVSSCDTGEEVTFTGVQLATAQVPPDPTTPGHLNETVEHDASFVGLIVLVAAVVGVGLAVVGRAGGGASAATGLIALQLYVWVGLLAWDGEFDVLEGYGLALTSFAVAGVFHLVLAIRRRRRAGARSWRYALGAIALALTPTLALCGLVLIAASGGA